MTFQVIGFILSCFLVFCQPYNTDWFWTQKWIYKLFLYFLAVWAWTIHPFLSFLMCEKLRAPSSWDNDPSWNFQSNKERNLPWSGPQQVIFFFLHCSILEVSNLPFLWPYSGLCVYGKEYTVGGCTRWMAR